MFSQQAGWATMTVLGVWRVGVFNEAGRQAGAGDEWCLHCEA